MKNLSVLGGELELLVARQRAALRNVPGPQALLSSLQGIEFVPGDVVIDSVTGQRGEILGTGITNIEAESTET